MSARPEPLPDTRRERLFTFASGGWVLLVATVLCLGLLAWALVPALVGFVNRPPGDGRTVESYTFDLDHLQVPRELVVPAMPHRDIVETIDDPSLLRGADLERVNTERGKYVLPSDRVIGVSVGGETRAYPVAVLTVHEIVNDELGGRPIAVTYHWPCDSVMVFDRRVGDRTVSFGVSGLVYNSNMLMYERRDPGAEEDDIGGEPLWSQMLAAAVSGEPGRDGERLSVIDATLTSWADWLDAHPETTVIDRDPTLVKRRYSKSNPAEYFLKDEIIFPVRPLPPADGPRVLARVVMAQIGDARRVYTLVDVRDAGGVDRPVLDELGDATLELTVDLAAGTLGVERVDDGPAPKLRHALWFAWHAFHPTDEVWKP